MDEKTIGSNAGKVWHLLQNKGKVTRYQLINELEEPAPQIDAAIGWLSKEGKINRDGEFFSMGSSNMDETIGLNAQLVFQVLKQLPYSVSALHKITELNAIEIHQAIGWLTREGNINLTSEPIISNIIDEQEKTLQFLKNETEILQHDVEKRNQIISQLSHQLTDTQTEFMHQALLVDDLQDRIDKREAIISLRSLNLSEKNAQISMLHQEIQSLHEDIHSRNQIITDLSKQLTTNQFESIKQKHAFEELHKQLLPQKGRLKLTTNTDMQERLSHVNTIQKTLEAKSELDSSFDVESKLYNSHSPALDIQQPQDVESVVIHPKSIEEIHQTVDQVIHDKIQKLKLH